MNVTIRHHGIDLTTSDREHLERSLHFALNRIDGSILSVTCFFADLNGPRGGIDKECRLLIHLNRGGFLAVEDADDDLHRLIDRITERAGQTVVRHIKRIDERRIGRLHNTTSS